MKNLNEARYVDTLTLDFTEEVNSGGLEELERWGTLMKSGVIAKLMSRSEWVRIPVIQTIMSYQGPKSPATAEVQGRYRLLQALTLLLLLNYTSNIAYSMASWRCSKDRQM